MITTPIFLDSKKEIGCLFHVLRHQKHLFTVLSFKYGAKYDEDTVDIAKSSRQPVLIGLMPIDAHFFDCNIATFLFHTVTVLNVCP